MSRVYRLLAISEAVAPITHMRGVAGNESLVATESVSTARGVATVPVLSGNALRHRAVRGPGMRHLIASYGLQEQLSLEQMNFLLHGGALTRKSTTEDLALVAEAAAVSPLVRLLGGALPAQILTGTLNVGRGILACEENRWVLETLLPPNAMPGDRLLPAESFYGRYQYTRGDVAGGSGDVDNRMIFAGQTVIRGSVFVHDFTICHGEIEHVGALVDAIARWQEEGGTVGGQAARGHGALRTALIGPEGVDLAAARAAYLDQVAANRDRFVAWLDRAFTAPPDPKAKGKGKKNKEEKDDEPLIEEAGDGS